MNNNLLELISSFQPSATNPWWQSMNFYSTPEFDLKNVSKFVRSSLFFRGLALKQTVHDFSGELNAGFEISKILENLNSYGYITIYISETALEKLYFLSLDNSVVVLSTLEGNGGRLNYNIISNDKAKFNHTKEYFEGLA